MIKTGSLVALCGPVPWACRVKAFVVVPKGGAGPLFPMGNYWQRGTWYLLQRLWLLNPDLEQFEGDHVFSSLEVFDTKTSQYRKATIDELIDAERFVAVWAYEKCVIPMQSESDIPLGCLSKIYRAECSSDYPAAILPNL